MDFVGAIKSGFKNYGNFRGMASRSEYWYWVLFTVLISVAAWTIDQAIGGNTVPALDPSLDTGNADLNAAIAIMNKPAVVSNILSIVLLLPNFTVTARRFHDAGFSGKWQWLQVVPVVALFIGLVGLTVTSLASFDENNNVSPDPELFFAALGIFGVTALLGFAYFLFQLIVSLRRTRTAAEGNKYAVKYQDTIAVDAESPQN